MASRAVFRLTLPLLVTLTALTGLTAGCQPDEYAVFLTVRSEAAVDRLSVRTIILDPLDPRVSESVHGVGRSQEEINGDSPIRVTVELNEPHPVMVHLEGINSRGIKVVATRCYEITNEVIEDGIRLVPLANDRDGDGFVENPDEACFDADGDPCDEAYPHRCMAAIAADCHEGPMRPIPDEELDCDPIDAEGNPRVPCDRTATPPTGCCDPPQRTYPGAPELCNDGIDQSCDRPWVVLITGNEDYDGDVACTDEDEDGFAKCSPFSVVGTCDCNDNDPTILPMRDPETRTPCAMRPAEEQADCDPEALLECENGRDEDCDGFDRDCDLDGDGFGTDDDCNDADPAINRGAMEVCTPTGGTPVDEDCNGLIDELATCAPDDQDRDGSIACQVSMVAGCDCNDCDAGIRVGATEICGDGIDQDCDGLDDDPCDPGDADGDGFLAAGRDCNDMNALVYPEAPEQCGDSTDNDCDGEVDEGCGGDTDGDGWVEPATCEGNPAVSPGAAEMCDAIDNNCNTTVNEVYSMPGMGRYADGIEGCVLCPAGAAMEWCVVDITGDVPVMGPDSVMELAKRLSFQNCGGCRLACDLVEANDCGDGVCICTDNADAPCIGSRCCGTGCEELDDPANCGACGSDCNAIPGDERPTSRPAADNCIDGSCACGTGPACGEGQMCCGGSCVAFDDPRFCGACGSSCFDMPGNAADQNCEETSTGVFQCVCADPVNQADCDGDDASNGCETNLRDASSILNCGGCGIRCTVANGTPTCNSGTCAIGSCNANYDDCNRNYGNGCETNLRTLTDCGSCGTACSRTNASATCGTGSCRINSCNSSWDNCDGNDRNGCEVNVQTISDCGSCGFSCSSNNGTPACSSSSCSISCNGGWDDCSGGVANGCETRITTTSNCGRCGNSCSNNNGTPACTSGSCAIACSSGWDNCDGDVTDGCETSLNNVATCGNCSTTCSNNNGTPSCPSGSCAIACSGGWGNCDGDVTDGCETAVNTVTQCGSCTNTCSGNHGTPACTSGSCAIGCDANWDNCNGDITDGCETSIDTVNRCGSCSNSCSDNHGTRSCNSGSCAISCDAGWDDCNGDITDGCEAQLGTETHCASCGDNCPGMQTCSGVGGTCG